METVTPTFFQNENRNGCIPREANGNLARISIRSLQYKPH